MPDDRPTIGKIIGAEPGGGYRVQPGFLDGNGQFLPYQSPLGLAFEANDIPVPAGTVVAIFGDRFAYSPPAQQPAPPDAESDAEHFRTSGHCRRP